jgi:hypothetical protein
MAFSLSFTVMCLVHALPNECLDTQETNVALCDLLLLLLLLLLVCMYCLQDLNSACCDQLGYGEGTVCTAQQCC